VRGSKFHRTELLQNWKRVIALFGLAKILSALKIKEVKGLSWMTLKNSDAIGNV